MAKLSITTAWNETADFVKRDFGPLFLIAFGLMVLPSIIIQVLVPQSFGPAMTASAMTGPPQLTAGSFLTMLAAFLVILLLSLWGNLTITILALRRQGVIGEAFQAARGRIVPLILASLLLGLAMAALAIPLVATAGAAIVSGQVPGGTIFLLVLAYLVLFLFFGIRLMLMTPVAAAESLGPIGIIRRSWEVTSGHFWKLLGFILLLFIVFFVVTMVVGALFGILISLIFGPSTAPSSLGGVLVALVAGVCQAVFVMLFATMLARIYDQLAGGVASTAEVFE